MLDQTCLEEKVTKFGKKKIKFRIWGGLFSQKSPRTSGPKTERMVFPLELGCLLPVPSTLLEAVCTGPAP